jgi:immune inhibitor A
VKKFLTIASSVALLLSLAGPAGAAQRAADGSTARAPRSDNHAGPLTERQEARRKAAMKLILAGKAAPNKDGVIQLADDKYFQAAVTGTGQIFTILSEFGTDGLGKYGTVPGPLHNQIPKPNRQVVDGQANAAYNPAVPYDNYTHWHSDFNTAYYEDLFFGPAPSFADFYTKQSSGNYTVAGAVSDWVTVPHNASFYGDNAVEDTGGLWQYIEDSGNAWYDAQKTAGMSDAQINAYLAQFDVWDRYDYDNDGDFDEPDGYIDHFQTVHAGVGEDAGGGAQGADAIWSQRWYVNPNDYGLTGPKANAQFGGSKIGNSNYWLGDFTVEAENGGLGVFAHEFGHDLGLPDFYDTTAGENGTAFWTLMSSGSWMNDGTEDIGSKPDYMGPWEKLQLGWLDYSVVGEGGTGDFSLDPGQAVIADVPDQSVTNDYVDLAGGHAWWTSSADDLNTTLARTLDLSGVKSATVSTRAWYDIEEGYDYLYGEYSTDGGSTWTQLGTPLTGSSNGKWKTLKYTVPGGSADTQFRYRFQSDGGVHLANAFLDDFVAKSGGTTLFTDDVENGPDGWVADGGFRISTGSETVIGDRYYIAENRAYVGYDKTLETGPYQFSFAVTDPDKVEHFSFQDGLLVWMVDETYDDNDNSQHPGKGLALPVDARFVPFKWSDGTAPSNRRQPFDATFGLQAVPAGPTFDAENPGTALPCEGLHKQVIVGKGKAQALAYLCAWPTAAQRQAIPVFLDSSTTAYWDATNPQNSVKTAGYGTRIEVTGQAGNVLAIAVDNAP